MPAITLPIPPGHPVIAACGDGDWIVVLENRAEAEAWFPGLPRAWLVVPLNHLGTLIGFVVLARARAQFRLDREVFDLLRVIGREVASRVAEQRAAQVLLQTRQLRAYSQRFAFVVHDIKNVSGQLSMLLSNAEVHADNPEFQRDMLATVRASVAKITRLLTRLQAEQQERCHALIMASERLGEIVERLRVVRRTRIELVDDGADLGISIDPEAFEAVVTHLINNAIEASGDTGPIRLEISHDALSATIDVTDQGAGMTPEFVRDQLFQPFATTKGGGHGIGAYQARELLREAGGDLLVLSAAGRGTTMRILLPLVTLSTRDVAALPV
jgi:putative PEP-CTERM system histidine kinase